MHHLFTNIRFLFGTDNSGAMLKRGGEMKKLGVLENAWLLVEDGTISDFGKMDTLPESKESIVNLNGKSVLPAYCDSHTHLVFAAPREGEFSDRIHGMTYEEIAKRGGGILNSARKLAEMDEDHLFELAKDRLADVIRQGTGAIEIKSGYGLSFEAELKMLRVIKRLKDLQWIPVKSTLLAAHALPPEYKNRKEDYLRMIGEELMPEVQKQGLAEYVDVFCEDGYFSVTDTRYLLLKGLDHGLRGKIHVNQFNILGGVKEAVMHQALSVDHLELCDDNDITALRDTHTMVTALPSCSFFLSLPYTPVRKMMEAGLPVALATDFNPGSTPSGNMNFVFSLACIKMKMTPEEALNALTINGAYAMDLSEQYGSITRGKKANFTVTRSIPSLAYLPYAFGDNHIAEVYINGQPFKG